MDSIPLIGEVPIELDHFRDLELLFAQFQSPDFKAKSSLERFCHVNEELVKLIQNIPSPAFLLAAVIDYIDRVNRYKIFKENYHFNRFEFWLNCDPSLTPRQKYAIRAKIAGQHIPREDYQLFFPIGMGHSFSGTHYVTAHLSPDIDTTIASFWGWMDAFAAQISDGLHLWSLPGGPPESPVTQLFKDNFGASVFSALAKQSGTLTLSAIDLISIKDMIRERGHTQANKLFHGFEEKAIILIDDKGHYLGDWRSADVEPVRQLIILFNLCLSWLESTIHTRLIFLFAKDSLTASEIAPFAASLFDMSMDKCEPIYEYTEQQRNQLRDFLIKILGMPKGLNGTFRELSESLKAKDLPGLDQFHQDLKELEHSNIFDKEGRLIENRPQIFNNIQKLIESLDKAAHLIRSYLERLDIAIQTKHQVLEKTLHYLTLRNDIEDIKIKMTNYSYLTVVYPEEDGSLYPVGVVWGHDLRKTTLGTVSFRDFCNSEEVKMASYLSVISIVDHHKTSLKTSNPPLAIVSDVQSCNVLVAELAMELNARYSTAGMTKEEIVQQVENIGHGGRPQLLQQLIKRQIAADSAGEYYIHPLREFVEYLYFIHAILDDTDLLTKVSGRDVYCVMNLLNRLKTLANKKETEILQLDDLPKTLDFPKAAAARILKNPDMYSIYKKIYILKEEDVLRNIRLCVEGKPSTIFLDTKEQNGCCRVGQTKLFPANYPIFAASRPALQNVWLETAQNIYKSNPELDFHLQMISTIPSADDVFHDRKEGFPHQDEFWFWLPESEHAQHHLGIFLSAFQNAPEVKNQAAELELHGSKTQALQETFYSNFAPLDRKKTKFIPGEKNFAALKFKAGSLNSRKSMVSPYLPKLVP